MCIRDRAPPTAGELGAEQRRAADAGARGTILLSGPAGTGKTEAAARRIAALGGTPVLALAANRASARRLRERVDQLRAEQPGEETWIGTWESIGERLLREQATAAGVDPFFDVLGRAEHVEERVDASGGGLLAQQPLADALPCADPGLFAGLLGAQLVDPLAQSPRAGPISRQGQHRGAAQGGDAPCGGLGLAGAGRAAEQDRSPSAGVRRAPLLGAQLARRRGCHVARRPRSLAAGRGLIGCTTQAGTYAPTGRPALGRPVGA